MLLLMLYLNISIELNFYTWYNKITLYQQDKLVAVILLTAKKFFFAKGSKNASSMLTNTCVFAFMV